MSMQRYDGVVLDTNGNSVSGASVVVKLKATGANATIYSDEGITPKTNPITTGSDGSYWFYAANGDYTVTGTYGSNTFTLGDVTLSGNQIVECIKPDDTELVNNDTTLQDDDDLTFEVQAGERWTVRFWLDVESNAAADIKWKLVVPTGGGSTGTFSTRYYPQGAGGVLAAYATINSPYNHATTGGGNHDWLIIEGYFYADTAGTVVLQWAQNAAHASDTKIHIGSHLIAHRTTAS